jgi:hypothetical protein
MSSKYSIVIVTLLALLATVTVGVYRTAGEPGGPGTSLAIRVGDSLLRWTRAR